jgi:hypothetical protein
MTRPQGTILQQGSAYGLGANSPMVSLSTNGQMGWSPEHASFTSNQAYVRKHLIPILIEAPKLFQYLPNPADWNAALRALIETQWLQVDGLNAGLTATFTENAFGGSGLKQQDLTNIVEAESRPKHTYLERYGRPIQRFIRAWMTYAGMDPYTKFPMVSNLASAANLADLLADQTTATVLYIEPDAMGRKVQQSWLVFNMFPESTGDVIGSADKTQDMQTTNIDLQFTGLHQYGPGVDALAQQILNTISLVGASPYMKQAAIQEISADVRAAQNGFAAGVSSLAQRQVQV